MAPRSSLLICAGLTSLVWLIFGQTLQHQFVAYDDQNYVYQNPVVTGGFTPSGVHAAFTQPQARNWHPLTTLSHMLDAQLYGLNPAGHHLTNLLLHNGAAVLLFFTLRLMTGATWRSAFVAAVFAVHPLRVESVAWVAERKDVLSAFFFMVTLAMYARYAARPAVSRYLGVTIAFALGLMAKPMLVTLPLILLALDYWPLQRFERREPQAQTKRPIPIVILEKVPLLLLSFAVGVATLIAQKSTVGYGEQTPLLSRLGNASIACVTYIKQMFWPVDLAVFYPQPPNGWPSATVLSSIGLLTLISVLVAQFRKARPYLIVGWSWYLVCLLPTLGLIPVGLQAHADRYTYLPQIGLYTALTWLAGDLASRFSQARRLWMVIGPVAILALSCLAWAQTSSWRNTETLWRRAIAVSPNNDVANYNLALLALDRDRIDEAVQHLQSALTGRNDKETASHLSPALLRNVLGIALARKGRHADAIAEYRKAIELRDYFADAYTNLATALWAKGDRSEAIEHFRKAKDIPPEDARSHLRLAMALERAGQTSEAITEYRRALDLDPRNARTHYLLATALEAAGKSEEARLEAARAIELDSSQVEFKALQDQLNKK
ncbi:MAG TPA: tetratricopeptide repeat protein [Chthoniobacterales bacterium]|jgi:Flp pilus assembly protein TadD|nr:tetratricopeptide repeat protein [Chthoniobacterales bacterium]